MATIVITKTSNGGTFQRDGGSVYSLFGQPDGLYDFGNKIVFKDQYEDLSFYSTDAVTIDGLSQSGNTAVQIAANLRALFPNANSSSGGSGKDAASADYTIHKIGSNITAFASSASGLDDITGTDAYTVIQAAINALQTGAGGEIYVHKGTYSLTNELIITGWDASDPPDAQIKITGAGSGTVFGQQTAGKHGIIVRNKASIVFRDFFIYAGSSAKSCIFLSNLGTSEVSVFGGVIDNIFLQSNSTTDAAFRAVNFFDLQVDHLYAFNDSNHGVLLESTSSTLNYGNSHFGFIRCGGGNTSHAALRQNSSTTPYKYINNLSFSNIEAISGLYGIYLQGSNNNVFHAIDIEYLKYPIYLDGTANNEVFGNKFLGGYILPQGTGCVGITANAYSGGNTFNMYVDGASTIVPVNDTLNSAFRGANSYDLVLGFNVVAANIVLTSPQALMTVRKSNGGATTTRVPTQLKTDNSQNIATTEFVGSAGRQIYASNVQLANTGNTTENTKITTTIPAGTLGVNGSIHFYLMASCTNNANLKTIRIKINGTTVVTVDNLVNNVFGKYMSVIVNRNSLTSQFSGANASQAQIGFGTSSLAPATYSFDTGATLTVTVTSQNATGTDALNIESFQIIAFP